MDAIEYNIRILLLSFDDAETTQQVFTAIPDWLPVNVLQFRECGQKLANTAIYDADMVFILCTDNSHLAAALRCVNETKSRYEYRSLPVLIVRDDVSANACKYRVKDIVAHEVALLMPAILANVIKSGLIGVDLADCYTILGHEPCRIFLASVRGNIENIQVNNIFDQLLQQTGRLSIGSEVTGCIVTFTAGFDLVWPDEFETIGTAVHDFLAETEAPFVIGLPCIPEMLNGERQLDVLLVLSA